MGLTGQAEAGDKQGPEPLYSVRMHKSAKLIVAILFAVLSVPVAAHAFVQAEKTFFKKGDTRLSLVGGSGQAFDQTYFILGAGLGFYVWDELEVGLDFEVWMGDDPGIYKISPQIRYVFPVALPLKPYVGTFYRRTFYEGLDDLSSIGVRAGVYSMIAGNAYFGFGLVYDQLLDCDRELYECTDIYPEIVLSIAF